MLKEFFLKNIYFIQNSTCRQAYIYDLFEAMQWLPSCTIGCHLHNSFKCL